MKEDSFKQRQVNFFDQWAIKKPLHGVKHEDKEDFLYRYNTRNFQGKVSEYYSKNKQINRILDCGCGSGEFTFLIKKTRSDSEITGIDISKKRIKKAQEMMIKEKISKVKFVFADAENLPFSDNYFDSVFSVNLIHHLPGFDALTEMIRVTKKNGTILIIDLTADNIFIEITRKLWRYFPISIKRKNDGDLEINGKIPDKHNFSGQKLKKELIRRKVKIIKEDYGNLFLFLFIWCFKMFPQSKKMLSLRFLQNLAKIEDWLIKKTFMKRLTQVVVIEGSKL